MANQLLNAVKIVESQVRDASFFFVEVRIYTS